MESHHSNALLLNAHGLIGSSPISYGSRKELDLQSAWRQLSELNFRFLESAQRACFPGSVGEALQPLSISAKRALASAPFSLFSIPLQGLSSFGVVRDTEHLLEDGRSTPCSTEWATAVAFFVWHLAHTDSFALSMLCALEEAQAEQLRSLPVTAVADIADGLAPAIGARWATNAYFWPTAIHCAAGNDLKGLRTVLCLGRQLLARDRLAMPDMGRAVRRAGAEVTSAAKRSHSSTCR